MTDFYGQAGFRPHIVAIGGTLRNGSSTEKALRFALDLCRRAGATTHLVAGSALDMPVYVPEATARTEAAQTLVDHLRRADGVMLASPGYHAGISGLVKNALDYTEDLRSDDRPYLDQRAVICIGTGAGWQGAIATLSALRNVVYALRGWPVPMGVALNTAEKVFDDGAACVCSRSREIMEIAVAQLLQFTMAFHVEPARDALRREMATGQ